MFYVLRNGREVVALFKSKQHAEAFAKASSTWLLNPSIRLEFWEEMQED